MCNKSESIVNLAKALVAFSGEVKTIAKDGNNPHFKSAYTTLDNMIEETKPLLTKHGLTVMQFPGGDGEKVTMRTMILHESGEFIESEPFSLKPVKLDPQGAGSAVTYARRYTYAAALSLALGDDDDGNSVSYGTQAAQKAGQERLAQEQAKADARPPAASNGALATEGQAKMIYVKAKEIGCSFERISDHLGYDVKTGADVKKADVNKVLEIISGLKEQVGAH